VWTVRVCAQCVGSRRRPVRLFGHRHRAEDQRTQSKKNTQAAEAKRKKLIAKKQFELADYVRKKIGNVGSNPDSDQSGR